MAVLRRKGRRLVLIDENLSPPLKLAVLRLNPNIDILRIGDDDAPPLGTLDPNVLRYLNLSQRVLITDNRSSLPGHLEVDWAEGGHIGGLFWVRPKTTLGELAKIKGNLSHFPATNGIILPN